MLRHLLPFDLVLAGHLPSRLHPCLVLSRPFVISCLLICYFHIMTIDPCCLVPEQDFGFEDADPGPCCYTCLRLCHRLRGLCNCSCLCRSHLFRPRPFGCPC